VGTDRSALPAYLDQPPQNTRARYNVCPTTQVDTIVSENGSRRLVSMRWGLIPNWWSKPLKEMKLATFNARAGFISAAARETSPFPQPFDSSRAADDDPTRIDIDTSVATVVKSWRREII